MENIENPLKFTDHSKPLREVIRAWSPPMIVKYDQNQQVVGSDPSQCPEFDPSETLLLHSVHETQRVHAHVASFYPQFKSFEDEGFDVTIDENYPGWFAVFGNPSDHHSDPVVSHYKKVSQLAISPCTKFLISGQTPLEAMKLVKRVDGSSGLKSFTVSPGTVLTRNGMYIVKSRIKVKKTLLKKKLIRNVENFLSCIDERNNEVLLSCQAQGIFYVLAQESTPVKTPIMNLRDIIARQRFPLLVKLVHGRTVRTPKIFHGTFVLLKSEKTKLCLASTLFTTQQTYFEIAADTSLQFHTTTNSASVFGDGSHANIAKKYPEIERTIFQAIRFRSENEGKSSARSSSTSGHWSGQSCEDERLDWSRIDALADAPVFEHIEIFSKNIALFTYQTLNPTTVTQVEQRSSGKVRVTTQSIERVNMYETPACMRPVTIPVTMKHQGSLESYDGTDQDEGTRSLMSTSSFSSENSFPPDGGYGRIWGDGSDERPDVLVEGVTLRSVPRLDSSVLCSNGSDISENQSRHSDEDGDVFYKDYISLQGAMNGIRNSGVFAPHDLIDEDDGYEKPYNLLARNGVSKRGVYERLHGDSNDIPYETIGPPDLPPPRSQNVPPTKCPGDYNIYDEPMYARYTNVPEKDGFQEPVKNTHDKDYERAGSVFIRVGTNSLQKTDSSTRDTYVEPSKVSEWILKYAQEANAEILYSEAASLPNEEEYIEPNDDNGKNTKPLYQNINCNSTPSSSKQEDEGLLMSMKHLCLKPATMEVMKGVDTTELKSILKDEDMKGRLQELLPGISQIDLRKITCFFDGNAKA